MQTTKNPYATNQGGMIQAPNSPAGKDPKSVTVKGDDLRCGK